jgi:tRNA G18 (ribose-2'-O)-methylase SpoU
MPAIHIDNPSDSRLADYRLRSDPELLRTRGLFVAEGRIVVARLLTDQRHRVRSLLLNPAAHREFAETLAPWIAQIPTYVCKTTDFASITGFNIHRGCLALAERPEEMPWDQVTANARTLVVLEGVSNADNVGGVFRNAAAFGADAVLLSPTCCDPFYRKAIRTSMAATLRVPVARVTPWPDRLKDLREAGFTVLAFTPREDAVCLTSFFEAARPARLALIFGGEGEGLTGPALQFAHTRVRIPIRSEVDSLNLTVAAGIALFWAAARGRAGPGM